MGKKKKPFIDKKNAHSFQLVHRSQRDPLQADEDSSKHVLVSLDSEAQGATGEDKSLSRSDQLEERKQYGIDYVDDYDYLQHLKTRTDCTLEPLPDNITVIENKKEKPNVQFGKLQLPSEAFASKYEEKEGLLNLAAPAPGPHPEWDPDIVAALDGDFDEKDPDNALEDDFFIKANEPIQDNDSDDDLIRSDDDDDEDERYFPSDEEGEDFDGHSEGSGFSFGNEETKSRFTNYSMTSSVIRRNEGLTLLDDRFEKLMEEYDEDEIGALDHEEMTGTVDPDSKILNALAQEFVEQHVPKVRFADTEPKENQSKKSSSTYQNNDNSDSDDNDELMRIDVAPKEQWDCESILSTYSNLYNHPTLIKETSKKPIKLSSKTGIPLGVLPGKQPTKNNNDSPVDMDTDRAQLHTGPRPRHEDKEEKVERKKAVKEQRRARRIEKKTNKLTFKAEEKRQEQSLLNTKHQKGQKL